MFSVRCSAFDVCLYTPARRCSHELVRAAWQTDVAKPGHGGLGHVRLRRRIRATPRPEPAWRGRRERHPAASGPWQSHAAHGRGRQRTHQRHRPARTGRGRVHQKILAFLKKLKTPTIISIWGTTVDEYAEVARRFDTLGGVGALELNVSCPNIKEGGAQFGTDVKLLSRVVAACRKATELPLITKMSPNVVSIAPYAKAAEEAGSNALAVTNSYPAMAIDIETRKPKLANITGGLTGPAIKPIAIKLVWEAAKAVKIPIIGMGGIQNAADAIEFMMAGATAVAVGTANFYEPQTPLQVIAGIRDFMQKQGIKDVREITVSVRQHISP